MSSSNCRLDCQMADVWTNSKLKVDKVTYIWTINDFDFREAVGGVLQSPTFSNATNDEVKWCVDLYPNSVDIHDKNATNGDESDSKDTIGVYVRLSELSKRKEVFAKFTISLLNEERKKVAWKSIANVRLFKLEEPSKAERWGNKHFYKKDDYFRTKILSNNKLILLFEITFSQSRLEDVVTHHQCDAPEFQINISKWNSSEDLTTVFKNHQFSDVILSVKGRDFPAHKVILAARSPVFAAMFQHDTKENQLNRVDIDDMEVEVAEKMLRFIYTGECEILDGSAEGLLTAADKYNLNQLKAHCGKMLSMTLSIENAANILVLADMHCAGELKTNVLKFIVAKHAQVFDTAGWRNVLPKSHLVDEVCRAMARR